MNSTNDRTDLLIVFPNNRQTALGALGSTIAAVTPPVQDGLTTAFLRSRGFTVRLLDADADGLMPSAVAGVANELRPSAVLVSSDMVNTGDVTKMAAAGETVRAVKRVAPELPVILQGIVPSAFPERMLREEGADYVCKGEPYEPVAALLSAFRKRGSELRLADCEIPGIWAKYGDDIVSSPHAPMWADADALPMAAWDAMSPAKYRAHHWHCFDRLDRRTPYAAIFTNFGCPYNCTFCSVNVVAGRQNLRYRSTDSVMAELELLVEKHGVRNIRILDNVFTARLDRVEELCDRISARWSDLNFWAYARVESVKDPAILRKIKKAGVNWLAYGFETASEAVGAAVRKGTTKDMTDQVVEWTRSAGINIVANFIFGLPEDDEAAMRRTLDTALRNNFEWANFYSAMAYPGTKLYEQAVAANVPLPKTWSGYSQYSPDAMPLPTKHLTSKQVLAFRDLAFKEYYGNPAYLAMIEKKFGAQAVSFVKDIMSLEIKRN